MKPTSLSETSRRVGVRCRALYLAAALALTALIPAAAHATIDTLYTYSFDFSIYPSGGPVVDAVVTVGDTVRWVRLDGNHTTTSVAGSIEQWDAPLNSTTPTFDHQFTNLGTFWFYCKPHGFDNGDGTAGGMSGTVTVLPAGDGACCLPSGCEFLSAASCQLQGGTFQGVGVGCTPEPCPNAPVTVTLTAAKDNTLYEDATGSKSNGAGQYIYTGNQNSGLRRRGVVAFDLSGIPSTAFIENAALSLYCNNAAGSTINVALHRLTATWGEGTSVGSGNEGSGGTATTNDATWLHRFYNTVFWATAGGDFVATQSATLSVPAVASTTYQWSGSGLVADVQSWVQGSAVNAGWVIRGDEASSSNVRRFASRETSTASQRPSLQVTFLPTTPAGACCLPDGTCDSLTAAQCAAASGIYQGDNTSCAGRYCPLVLSMYVDSLPRPIVATPISGTAGGTASYALSVTQVKQKLHRDLPATTLWGYGGMYPGPTIEASVGNPVTVTWRNDLRDSTGALLTQHFLPVDLCMHGPDMAGPAARTVVHLHGGHVGPESDGYPEQTILPGEGQTFHYPNTQPATTLWYHDHALGITRLNVIMGLAGFYLIRDAAEAALGLPANGYEIPIAIQDRMLKADGGISYPVTWKEMYFGDKAVVNGKVWPYLNVNRGKYRFRLLNGSNSRIYTLHLSNGAPFVQIGSDGGLLAAPVSRDSLTIAPGERADVVVDFASYSPGTEILLRNSAPAPYPVADPQMPVLTEIMKFVVQSAAGYTAPIPSTLASVPRIPESDAVQSRDFMLARSPAPSPCGGQFWTINGKQWDDVTEFPVIGTAEIWRFINMSEVTHPMHLHLVEFQILDRQKFTMQDTSIVLVGSPSPPQPYEAGWKDTAPVNPNEVVRVIARFTDFLGRYPYHCHVLEHEDHEMMRQFQVVSAPVTAVGETAPRYRLALHGARPNPFNPRTRIDFELPRRAPARLDVFDVSGRLVVTLVNGVRPAGPGGADWNGTDRTGNPVASGLYLYRLSFEGSAPISRKLVLLK
ncbi:MAG: multicopper oxidase domain-containing protein [Bacteroidota bacterium]